MNETASKDRTLELDVAILGGGFGGVYCAQALRKKLGNRAGLRIALISDLNYMVFQPMLAEVAGGGISPKHVVNPLRQLCRGIEIVKARVERIDLATRTLELRPGHYTPPVPARFNHLVISLGAEIDLSRVPGMPEHAYLMQNVGDAMRLHAAVISRCEEANLESHSLARRRLLTFVVVGGGYSGVETAGQILDLLHEINRFYNHIDPTDYRVVLVHSGEHILPTMSDKLSRYAEQKLRKAGLQIVLNTRVQAVTAHQVYLNDGSTIESNTVVCTVGNAPHRLVRQLCESQGLENQRGRIITLDTLQVPKQENLWACGDCASVPLKDGGFCPPTAQFAMRQGTLCGQNIARTIDDLPTKPFDFGGLGELAAIGRHQAVAKIGNINLSGFAAWWMWRTVYLMKLPGLERKIRVMIDWTLDLFFRRDTNLLNPEGTKLVNQIHLETGDRLFNAGDPPFSLYVLTEGRVDLMDGGRAVKSIAPGEHFGERALTKDRPYIYDAVAAQPSTLTSLDGDVFLSLVNHSSVLKRLFKRTATQYKTPEEMWQLKARIDPAVAHKRADEIMQRNLCTLRSDMTLTEAVHAIKAHRYSSYPVLDADGICMGAISREDLFCVLKSSSTPMETHVGKLELRQLPIAQPNLTASELIEMMLMHGCNKLLVNSEDGKLTGIVAILDLVCETASDQQSADASEVAGVAP